MFVMHACMLCVWTTVTAATIIPEVSRALSSHSSKLIHLCLLFSSFVIWSSVCRTSSSVCLGSNEHGQPSDSRSKIFHTTLNYSLLATSHKTLPGASLSNLNSWLKCCFLQQLAKIRDFSLNETWLDKNRSEQWNNRETLTMRSCPNELH